jgi:D-aminopeptidase
LSVWTSQGHVRFGDLGIVIGGFEMLGLAGYESVQSVNPVAGETNDGYLSDIRARPITQQHVLDAIEGACGGAVDKRAALATVAPVAAQGTDERRGNSCMIVVATDLAGGSGDCALAFSTVRPGGPTLLDASLDPVFRAAVYCVEEAVLNSLFMATTTAGWEGHVLHATPHRYVREALPAAGVLDDSLG